MARFVSFCLFALLSAPGVISNPVLADDLLSKTELGEVLFFDTSFSKNRNQACASCHDPASGFTDPRDNEAGGAVSLGDDDHSLGDRNAPTASYAALTPLFTRTKDGKFKGGQFHDGRASSLTDQAQGPPLNPIEMGMADEASVVERLKENALYVENFKALFGDEIFDDTRTAFVALADTIAAFEKTEFFAPFDSKYDRALRGDYEMTPLEDLGMTLFFSEQFTNCNQCHQLKPIGGSAGETFTNYEYHNIGVPTNQAVRAANGMAPDHQDLGLFENPAVDDPAQKGKFKTPGLRNIAVTGPYMHNGVFADLMTVIKFYNKYNSKAAAAQINPETGQPWAAPEVPENLSMTELEHGDALDERRMKALVAFLKTLTDQRYEHLLDE